MAAAARRRRRRALPRRLDPARLVGGVDRRRRPQPGAGRFSVRVLAGEADGAAFAAFHERTVGLAATLPADGGVTVGLFAGEALVGVVYLDLGAHRGLCSSMLIAPEQRGHGGAVLLLGALVTEARRRGLTVLTAEVDVRNFASRATTRRLGFVTVGPAPRDGDPFDGSERELLVLHLDPPPPR
jgi:L-amino acid N-acyltransferase YncA